MSKTLVPLKANTSDHVSPPSLERESAPPMLPSGAMPARTTPGATVETAASNTSPPGGPSKDQAPFPAGRTGRGLRGFSGTKSVADGRFPCSSSRRAGPELDGGSFSADNACVLDSACGELIRVANVLDMAPRPASRTQPLSNPPKNPSNRRELELKRLGVEGLFIVRSSY